MGVGEQVVLWGREGYWCLLISFVWNLNLLFYYFIFFIFLLLAVVLMIETWNKSVLFNKPSSLISISYRI